MYKVSVTTLEKFRRFMADTSSYDTEQALIDTIAGLFTGNDKTRVGSAFHKIIEDPGATSIHEKDGLRYIVSEGIAFPEEQAQSALQYRRDHPLMINEVNVSAIYETSKYSVLVSGRVDCIEGLHVRDAKTKFRAPSSVSEYTDSYQWRYYLDILKLKSFFYDLFEVKRFKGLFPQPEPYILKDIIIEPHEPIVCYSYINLHNDCVKLVSDFMEYIETRNFFHLLKVAEPAELERAVA